MDGSDMIILFYILPALIVFLLGIEVNRLFSNKLEDELSWAFWMGIVWPIGLVLHIISIVDEFIFGRLSPKPIIRFLTKPIKWRKE